MDIMPAFLLAVFAFIINLLTIYNHYSHHLRSARAFLRACFVNLIVFVMNLGKNSTRGRSIGEYNYVIKRILFSLISYCIRKRCATKIEVLLLPFLL